MGIISARRVKKFMVSWSRKACFKYFIITVLGAFFSSAVWAADASFSQLVGTAYSAKSGQLLYRETHQKINENEYEVVYSEPNGDVFGHKTLDFSQSKITPSFHQSNERNGERIDVIQSDNALLVSYQEDATAGLRERTVKLVSGMVVDAGFDAFIKRYWAPLLLGKELDIEYLVPSKHTTFSFRFRQENCLEGTQSSAQCFSLKPVSWLIKLAVDPIVVAYDPITKRLLRFSGRANICDTQGKYENVDIHYRYF